ncbi:MAG: CDP-alcohol phosphatidyltransferase family protein [Promethearchaeota archaeon]
MPSKFRVRGIFKPLVVKIAAGLSRKGMKPNQATLVMFILSICSIVYLQLVPMTYIYVIIFGVLVFITGVMDGIDGSIARLTGTSTKFGAIFDSTMDRYSDAFIFFAPALREILRGDLLKSSIIDVSGYSIFPFWLWSFILLTGAYMTSYTRARVTLAEPRADMDIGLLGRSERLIILVIGSIINAIPITILILAIASTGTAIYRLVEGKKRIKTEVE